MKQIAKVFASALFIAISVTAQAQEKIKMNFPNEEIGSIIGLYSKASGKKFIVDSTVRGRISLFNPTDVTLEEAYNQLSVTLALNGFAIVKQGDNYIVRNARSAQRDLHEVSNDLPAMLPERMVTWIFTVKNLPAHDVMSQLRMLTSSYGEMSALEKTNQIVISDWSTNLQRVADVMKKVDVPTDPSVLKIVTQAKKDRMERMARKDKEPKDMKTPHMTLPPPSDEKETN